MMGLRSYGFAWVGGILLALLSCTQEPPASEGCITLSFCTEAPETKATGNAADGGKIVVDGNKDPDLIIAIVNSSNTIIAWYPQNFGSVPGGTSYTSEVTTTLTASTDVNETTITVSGPAKGTYTVYAVANTNAANLTTARASLAAATTLAGLEAVTLPVGGGGIPSFSAMPLSAKGTLSVNASGSGQIDLALLRVAAKVGLTFENKTGDALNLYACSVTLYEMSPSVGYLYPRDNDMATGVSPTPNLSLSGNCGPISNNDSEELDSKLVFASTAPYQLVGRRYYCDIYFRTEKDGETYDSEDSSTYDEHTYTNLPVHDSRSADIQAIERNKRYNIMTRINKRAEDYEVSFNFEVCPWTEVTQSIEFD